MRAGLILAAIALAVAACTEGSLSGFSSTSPAPLAAVSDGANGGNPNFFFLPPMVPNPGPGTNDDALTPDVVICQWDGTACVATLATFTTDPATTTTTQPGNSEIVRSNPSHFLVNWHTKDFELDPALTYRICVRVGDVGLGFADVDVVDQGGEQNDVAEGFVGVVNGRTLPIKFRIEDGALDEQGAGCGESPE